MTTDEKINALADCVLVLSEALKNYSPDKSEFAAAMARDVLQEATADSAPA